MKSIILASIFAVSFNLCAASSSWPQFRGPNSSGVAEKDKPPIQFGAETNLLWKIAAPSGLSSPCIAGDRIFLTGFETGKLFALCFNRRDGKELWRQEAPPGKIPEVHKVSSPAVATPATDGRLVYVYYVPFGLVAYDFQGRERWRKPVPSGFVMNGSGTSPAIVGDAVVLNCDQEEGGSFLLAVEARTGKPRWQIPRAGVLISSFTTPIAWKHGARQEVVVSGSLRVAGYDLQDGQERWTARVLTSVSVAATPVLGEEQLYVMSQRVPQNAMGTFASFAEKNDKNNDGKISADELPADYGSSAFRGFDTDKDGFITEKDWAALNSIFAKGDSGLVALRAPGDGDVTGTHVVWKQTKGVASIASPLFYRGRIYAVQDGGKLTCWNAKTGQTLYEQERLDAEGAYYASPIAANGHLYLTSARGTVTTVSAGDKFEVEARNELRESVMSTPAIADNKLYVRGAKHLWAFGKE
jgi:outer membrane protein assembly factor BamB